MDIIKMNPIGMTALRNAIVEQAAKDYLKNYRDEEHKSSYIKSIEKWFLSPNFDALATGYSGEYFLRKLREMSNSGKKIGNRSSKDYRKVRNDGC